jgi:hypothetical protein
LDKFTSYSVSVAAYAHTAAGVLRAGSAAIEIYNGSWLSLNETLKRMPMGVGEAYNAFIDLAGLITGATGAIKDLEKEWAAATRLKGGRDWIEEARETIGFQIDQLRNSPEGRQIANIDRKASQAQEVLDKAVKRGFPEDETTTLRAMIEDRRQGERGEILGKQDNARLTGIVSAQELASHSAKAWEDALFNLSMELAKAQGATDALAEEEATAKRNLAKELGAGTITSEQYRSRLSELSQTYGELALAAEGQKQDATNATANATAKAAAESLHEQMMTPMERAKVRIAEIIAMPAASEEDKRRAIQQAIEVAAEATERIMPSMSTSRGQFGGQNAWMLGALGVGGDDPVKKDIAKNIAELVRLARQENVAAFQ